MKRVILALACVGAVTALYVVAPTRHAAQRWPEFDTALSMHQ